MTTARAGSRVDSPEDLQRLMGTPYCVSEQQWAAISAPLEPAVVIAGAGSGKTSVMAARVVYLVATGQVQPDQVLGLTFTTKATAELASRVREALAAAGLDAPIAAAEPDEQPELVEPVVSTYNAYASALLAEHGLRIGHEPDTRVMADASRYQVAARAIERHTGAVELLSEHPKTAIDYLLGLDAELNEHLVSVERVRAFHAAARPEFEAALAGSRAKVDIAKAISKMSEREEVLDLVEGYRRLKGQFGLMDFSDQIALAAELAMGHPEVGRLEREKYRIVLLDEYQDTSVAQAQLLSALFSGPDVSSGRGHPVTAVGDPNQAIYGWRGASVSNILNFAGFFPASRGSAVPTYSLTVNRRSDSRILDVANALARPLYDRFDQVGPLLAKEGAQPGAVHTTVHETYQDELSWLADRVVESHEAMDEPLWSGIGVLTRDNNHAADVFDALTAREVPVEIVGLKGLMRLPEVSEVVATLSLLQDLTANADLLNLLNGPRWAIGPRDLALLGRRARALTGVALREQGISVPEELQRAVEGADPTEVLSLNDALSDPGDLPYSPEARTRFALLAEELRQLRAYAGEPLLDLVRRIIDVTGIDVELASSVSPAASARRDNLDLFVKAVADFQAIDGQVTLPSLLAWLDAEDEMGSGLDQATPSEADSVKLLTVHRAKGLEWSSVFLVGVCAEKFPVTTARSQWTTVSRVLPAPLRGDADDVPQLRGYDKPAIEELKESAKAHQGLEELRLGYVAFTRAKHELWVSSYQWSPTRQKPLAPSPYLEAARQAMAGWGAEPDAWPAMPEDGTPNPLQADPPSTPWPTTVRTVEHERRLVAAALVREEMQRSDAAAEELDIVDAATVAQWDEELERLLVEAREDRGGVIAVPLPTSLSATAMARLRDDPDQFARELARPMPRQPSPAARFGTRFHAWVEARFGQQALLEPDDLSGRGDLGIDDEDELKELIAAFEAGPFADRDPFAVEAQFALVLGGQVVRGRIDAVYAEPGGGWLVVDWKTNRQQNADSLQLAVYRVAWAELMGVPPDDVRAAFHYVRSGETVEPDDLADRQGLELILLQT
ncbi:MAG: UvrD/REP helicase [Marmoricola sp.]|nr:UvrD/REP helicase [Marmoricola sp.]